MRGPISRLVADARGASAIEFGILAPAFLGFIIGIMQLGLIFMANSGLHNALAEGARLATLYPRPTASAIESRIDAARWGLEASKLTKQVQFVSAENSANGAAYADITMTYPVQPQFLGLSLGQYTLRQTRRVYVQPVAP